MTGEWDHAFDYSNTDSAVAGSVDLRRYSGSHVPAINSMYRTSVADSQREYTHNQDYNPLSVLGSFNVRGRSVTHSNPIIQNNMKVPSHDSLADDFLIPPPRNAYYPVFRSMNEMPRSSIAASEVKYTDGGSISSTPIPNAHISVISPHYIDQKKSQNSDEDFDIVLSYSPIPLSRHRNKSSISRSKTATDAAFETNPSYIKPHKHTIIEKNDNSNKNRNSSLLLSPYQQGSVTHGIKNSNENTQLILQKMILSSSQQSESVFTTPEVLMPHSVETKIRLDKQVLMPLKNYNTSVSNKALHDLIGKKNSEKILPTANYFIQRDENMSNNYHSKVLNNAHNNHDIFGNISKHRLTQQITPDSILPYHATSGLDTPDSISLRHFNRDQFALQNQLIERDKQHIRIVESYKATPHKLSYSSEGGYKNHSRGNLNEPRRYNFENILKMNDSALQTQPSDEQAEQLKKLMLRTKYHPSDVEVISPRRKPSGSEYRDYRIFDESTALGINNAISQKSESAHEISKNVNQISESTTYCRTIVENCGRNRTRDKMHSNVQEEKNVVALDDQRTKKFTVTGRRRSEKLKSDSDVKPNTTAPILTPPEETSVKSATQNPSTVKREYFTMKHCRNTKSVQCQFNASFSPPVQQNQFDQIYNATNHNSTNVTDVLPNTNISTLVMKEDNNFDLPIHELTSNSSSDFITNNYDGGDMISKLEKLFNFTDVVSITKTPIEVSGLNSKYTTSSKNDIKVTIDTAPSPTRQSLRFRPMKFRNNTRPRFSIKDYMSRRENKDNTRLKWMQTSMKPTLSHSKNKSKNIRKLPLKNVSHPIKNRTPDVDVSCLYLNESSSTAYPHHNMVLETQNSLTLNHICNSSLFRNTASPTSRKNLSINATVDSRLNDFAVDSSNITNTSTTNVRRRPPLFTTLRTRNTIMPRKIITDKTNTGAVSAKPATSSTDSNNFNQLVSSYKPEFQQISKLNLKTRSYVRQQTNRTSINQRNISNPLEAGDVSDLLSNQYTPNNTVFYVADEEELFNNASRSVADLTSSASALHRKTSIFEHLATKLLTESQIKNKNPKNNSEHPSLPIEKFFRALPWKD